VMAMVAINIGEVELRAVLWVPELPLKVTGAAMKWATDRIGGWAWVILGLAVAGGVYWYVKQTPERRESIKSAASSIGATFMAEYTKASADVSKARLQLRASMVPKPEQRTPASAILRELALSAESLSAAQVAELLDQSVRPAVADIRAFLRANDNAVFKQVRRGGFVLGLHYRLPG
jgi:hypothetical protein